MLNYLLISFIVGILSTLLVWLIRRWSLSHLLDIPNERSSHAIPTPSGGGLAITATTLIGFGIWQFRAQNIDYVWVFLLVGTLLGVISWLDDKYRLNVKLRLVLQFFSAIIIVWSLGALDAIQIWDGFVLRLPPLIGFIVTIFWILAFTNIYNFMDGIDGLAAMQAILGGTAWFILAYLTDQNIILALSLLIVATSIGFLYWNRPPAKIFMGDVGSIFIGFVFATLTLFFFQATNDPRAFVTGLFFVGVFAFDGGVTIIRRAINRENLLEAHRRHLYQRLVYRVGSKHHTVTTYYGLLTLVSIVLGFAYYYGGGWMSIVTILLEIIMCTALFISVTLRERLDDS